MSRTVVQPWPIDWPCDTGGVDAAVVERALASAQSWLWALSGRRYGQMSITDDLYRAPCSSECGMPYKDTDGYWRNGGLGGHNCCRILLESQPVTSITSVTLYGTTTLSPDDYSLEGNYLLRNGACWPCDDECDPAPISVSYTFGIVPDGFALAACGEVACEFLRGMKGDSCRLPSRAVSISRQGVSVEMDDASQFAANGLTGLPIADAWIATVNPAKLPYRSRVVSVDAARRA